MNADREGIVFNLQPYSLHDGPGIRTVVFLKGCPLRCRWCSNPESQNFYPEVGVFPDKCIAENGCNWCLGTCSQQALSLKEASIALDRSRCVRCLQCVEECPAGALVPYGKTMTVGDVLTVVERDSAFYRHGSGGMTLSGGEPLAQPEFALELLKEAKRRRIHTSMETCGCCEEENLKKAAPFLDHIFFDLKLLEEEAHLRETGGSNQVILQNLKMLFREFPDLPKTIRTPVIPGVNDSPEELAAIQHWLEEASYADGTPKPYTYETLPYHRFGVGKYRALGRAYPLELGKEDTLCYPLHS